MAMPAHDGNRHIMTKWSGAKLVFLFSPQSSVLSTHYLFLIDTRQPFTYYPFIKFFPI
jgi:hypothetical protein